jgi:hypothetical protein
MWLVPTSAAVGMAVPAGRDGWLGLARGGARRRTAGRSGSRSWWRRMRASKPSKQLEQLGQQVRESATATLELIGSTNAPLELRQRAVLALSAVGLENPDQARILFELLADPAAAMDLRRTILMAFGEKELFAPLLVPALLEIIGEKRDETALRREALFALRRFAHQESALPALVGVLADPAEDPELRLAVLDHVRMFVAEPAGVIEVLSALAVSRREPVACGNGRSTLCAAGGQGATGGAGAGRAGVGSRGGDGVAVERGSGPAPDWLGGIGLGGFGEIAVPPGNPERGARPRSPSSPAGWNRFRRMLATQWLPVLEEPSAPLAARRLAARMLATADLGLPDGLALSTRLLRDHTEDLQIRMGAGEFLRRSGVRAAPARETLEGILLSEEAPAELREVASTALAQVAQVWLDRPDQLDRATLNRHLAAIEHTVAVMAQADLQMPPHPQNLEAVRRLRDVLRAEKASRWSARLGDWAEAHPVLARWSGAILALGLCGGLLTALWWTMTRIAPLRLGALDSRLRRFELTFPRASGGPSFGLRHLLLLHFWGVTRGCSMPGPVGSAPAPEAGSSHRPGQTADGEFLDLPVKIDGAVHETCPFDFLFRSLDGPGNCVAIVGDAGTGKSTLARQMVRRACARDAHDPRPAFLPVWIDTPIRHARSDLIAAVRGQLNSSSRDHETPSAVLLETLLARGRVVPVLDGVSEWNDLERQALLQALDQLGNPSVLITARDAASLADRRFVQVETLRLAGPELARFVAGWLAQGEPGTAETDVLEACGYWTELTAGRAMPADIIRVFAEYL